MAPPLTALDLARTYLRDRDARIWPRVVGDELETLQVHLEAGPDHLAGERVLAHLVFERDPPLLRLLAVVKLLTDPVGWFKDLAGGLVEGWLEGADRSVGALLTDRRVALRTTWAKFDLPYAEIGRVAFTGDLAAFFGLRVLTLEARGVRHRANIPTHRALARFLQVAAPLYRSGRIRVPARPDLAPALLDPTGAADVAEEMELDDPRTRDLLHLVTTRWAAGELTTVQARELVRGTWMLGRNTWTGRGRHDGLWLSAVPAQDLLRFLEVAIGPTVETEPKRILDDRGPQPSDPTLKWVFNVTSGRRTGRWAVTIRDLGPFSGFEVEGDGRPPKPDWVQKLLQTLTVYESAVLMRRALMGPAPLDELLAPANAELADRLAAAGVPSIRPFEQTRPVDNFFKVARRRFPTDPLPLDQLPPDLPMPDLPRPPTVVGIGVLHLGGGLFSALWLPFLYLCGGAIGVSAVEQVVLTPLKRILKTLNTDATAGFLLLTVWGLGALVFVFGLVRWLLGWAYVVAPLRTRGLIVIVSLLGLLGILVGDLPGFVASVATFVLLRHRSVRDYYRQG